VTTVAYRDGILAADRQCSYHCMPVAKIRRLKDGSLVGMAGNGPACEEAVSWLDCGGQKPVIDKDRPFTLLRLYVNGRVEKIEDLNYPLQILLPYFAIGSGADYAMGAMAHGATAEEAVLIATKHDESTGGGVDTLALTSANVG